MGGKFVRTSWNGFDAQHRGEDLPLIAEVIRSIKPTIIIELGTGMGGMAAFFSGVVSEWKGKVITFDDDSDGKLGFMPTREDPKNTIIKRLLETYSNLEFEAGNVVSVPHPIILEATKDRISFLYCDNGNKLRELFLYAPYLSVGSIIGCHDYEVEVWPAFAKAIMDYFGYIPFRHKEFEALASPDYPHSLSRFWQRSVIIGGTIFALDDYHFFVEEILGKQC